MGAHEGCRQHVAVSGLRFGNALVGSGWATAVLLCMNELRKQSSHLAWPHFQWGSFFPSQVERLPAECRDCCKLLIGGCG